LSSIWTLAKYPGYIKHQFSGTPEQAAPDLSENEKQKDY